MTESEIVELKAIFARKLRLALDEVNMSQTDLAQKLHVSESTVGKWLLKKALPRMGIIEQLSLIFDKTKSYFLDDNNDGKQGYYLDPETAKLAQELYDNPDRRVLLDATRNLRPEDVKALTLIINQMTKKESSD